MILPLHLPVTSFSPARFSQPQFPPGPRRAPAPPVAAAPRRAHEGAVLAWLWHRPARPKLPSRSLWGRNFSPRAALALRPSSPRPAVRPDPAPSPPANPLAVGATLKPAKSATALSSASEHWIASPAWSAQGRGAAGGSSTAWGAPSHHSAGGRRGSRGAPVVTCPQWVGRWPRGVPPARRTAPGPGARVDPLHPSVRLSLPSPGVPPLSSPLCLFPSSANMDSVSRGP